jgi:SAM-dependent methyltransferase
MAHPFTERTSQFMYFDEVLDRPAWKRSKLLDFGGNIGGFLVGAGDAVDHENYWCIDLNQAVVARGRQNHPKARFIHYDRYHSEYNPEGIRNLPIHDCGERFDIIIAFSVFTHAHPVDMYDLVDQLRSLLTPRGVLAFTFTDPSYDRSLSDPQLPPGTGVLDILRRYSTGMSAQEMDDLAAQAARSRWSLLIDDRLYVEPGDEFSHQRHRGGPKESYCSFFKPNWIQELFPDGSVHVPVAPEWQHCCVLRNP